jgi:hypothetical protein
VAHEVVRPPLGSNENFERLVQGALGVVWPPQAKRGGHPSIFFSFFFFKCDGGIWRINRLNGLNCYNLKVLGGKVSHFKL